MNFILTIVLMTANGQPLPIQPASITYSNKEDCVNEMIATYATPMKNYRILKANCEGEKHAHKSPNKTHR